MKSNDGFLVMTRLDNVNRNPKLREKYPLLPEDLITREPDGTFMKEAPGFAVGGFELTDEQIAELKPVKFVCYGLEYKIITEEQDEHTDNP